MSGLRRHVAGLVALLCGLYAVASPANTEILNQANQLRANGCGPRAPVATPLGRVASLDAAAARIAAGDGLQAAANAEGYRARRVARIHVQNPGRGDLRDLLERQFCHLIADPEFGDAGVFEQGDESWLVIATPIVLPEGSSGQAEADRLFTLANDARGRQRRCGGEAFDVARRLQRSERLDEAARIHAQDIADRGEMGHEGSDGSTAAERVARTGYAWRVVGENVAAGQASAEEVVDTWLASTGHCRNLMDPRFTESGAAVATNPDDDQVIFWVQVYASRMQAAD